MGSENPPVKTCVDAPEIFHYWDEENEIRDQERWEDEREHTDEDEGDY